jgi:23S rRNA pseudouridine1911/1915/1917 synthase
MTNNTIKFLPKEEDVGKRLDIILSQKINNYTRSNLKRFIKTKKVKVNNLIVTSPSKKIKLNEYISLKIEGDKIEEVTAKKIKINVVYEDKDIVIINKPSGLVVHPGAGNYSNTLVNGLMYKYKKKLSDLNGHLRPGIVHRIDKDTSGLLVVAKNNLAHSQLGKQFSEHKIKRKYIALIWGVLRPLNGKIETLISRSRKNRQLMTVSEFKGKRAITNYFTKKIFSIKDTPKISLIECKLLTGRTHQIRVHMSYKGNSLLGDKKYGKRNIKFKKINKDFEKKLNDLNRQALHAKSLGFIHPKNNKLMNFESELPNDFKKMLDLLNKLSN